MSFTDDGHMQKNTLLTGYFFSSTYRAIFPNHHTVKKKKFISYIANCQKVQKFIILILEFIIISFERSKSNE